MKQNSVCWLVNDWIHCIDKTSYVPNEFQITTCKFNKHVFSFLEELQVFDENLFTFSVLRMLKTTRNLKKV